MIKLIDKLMLASAIFTASSIGGMLLMPVVPYRTIGFVALLLVFPIVDTMIKIHFIFSDNACLKASIENLNTAKYQEMLLQVVKDHNAHMDKTLEIQAKALTDLTQIAVSKETQEKVNVSN